MTKPKAPPAAPKLPTTGHTACDMALHLLVQIHAVEVRTLQGRIDDLVRLNANLQHNYNAVIGMLPTTSRAQPVEEPEGKESENPLRRSNPVQWILDSVEEEIPLSNQNARENLKKWVERQVRLRGQGSLDEILTAALAGDVSEEGEEE